MKHAYRLSAHLKFLSCGLFVSSFVAGVASVPALAHDDWGKHGGFNQPTVTTVDGPVRGFTKDGVNVFLGIPYAAPPIGKLRWRPPQPVQRWRETLDATQYANNCPQVTTLGSFAGPTSISEDCLYLNVFTTRGSRFGQKKPVIVWIHGGGNYDGGSTDYDGSKLATGGPNGVETVVVTLNYRLGLFGTFSHPAINSEGHLWGNYTTLDQQAALRWVQRNIAAFGGDPTRVALGGQSAGAVNTGLHLFSPLSKGLFQRAIVQSSPAFIAVPFPADAALNAGAKFAVAAGCPGSNAAAAKCLRDLSTARILQLQGTPNATGPYTVFALEDGSIVPPNRAQSLASGNFNRMPILAGSTKDEQAFFAGITEYFSGPPQAAITAEQFATAVAPGAISSFGDVFPAAAAAQYSLSSFGGDLMIAYNRAATDPVKCKDLHVFQQLASLVPTYGYDFTYQKAPYYFPRMPGFTPLSAHTIDIQFLFTGYHGGQLGVNLDQTTGQPRDLNSAESKLSDQMVAAWTNFAKTGNPNGSGNSPWPKFSSDSSARVFTQDIPISTTTVSQFRANYKCDLWDPLAGY